MHRQRRGIAAAADVAEHFLLHDRAIARRVDDSIVRVMGGSTRVLRRARGYAPAPLRLPDGFADAPPVLAMGGELKNTFCLLRDGEAVLSHHMGDLENAATYDDYSRSIEQYSEFFAHEPQAIAVDCHPDYLSTKRGMELRPTCDRGAASSCPSRRLHGGERRGAGSRTDARHHSRRARLGRDGTLWGGEFLLGDYRHFRGSRASSRWPCPAARKRFASLGAMPWLTSSPASAGRISPSLRHHRPRSLSRGKAGGGIASMIERGVNAPLASSCGRLFDAVAAALGLCCDRVRYEGQAAMMLEAVATEDADRLSVRHVAYRRTVATEPDAAMARSAR